MDPDAAWGVTCEWSRRRTGILDGGGDRRREGAVLEVNLGHPIVAGILRCGSSQITLGSTCLLVCHCTYCS